MEKLSLVRRKENMKKILLNFFITGPLASGLSIELLILRICWLKVARIGGKIRQNS
jgi:hypothetical protein